MCSEFRVTDRPRWASSVRRLEVRIALNCEAAFRFPGNFLADFKRKRQIYVRDRKNLYQRVGWDERHKLLPRFLWKLALAGKNLRIKRQRGNIHQNPFLFCNSEWILVSWQFDFYSQFFHLSEVKLFCLTPKTLYNPVSPTHQPLFLTLPHSVFPNLVEDTLLCSCLCSVPYWYFSYMLLSPLFKSYPNLKAHQGFTSSIRSSPPLTSPLCLHIGNVYIKYHMFT